MANNAERNESRDLELSAYLAEINRVHQQQQHESQKLKLATEAVRPNNFSDAELKKLNIHIGDPSANPAPGNASYFTRIAVSQEQYEGLKTRTDLDALITKFFGPERAMRDLVSLSNNNPALYRALNFAHDRGKTK